MAAFPLDIRTELQIAGVWTDVSTDVRVGAPMTITRGAADESSALEPSGLEFQLNNRDGRYSPGNPMSPYYGLIGRNTPVRVSVQGPESCLRLDASAASYARTPDAAALDITGDLDLRIEATCDWSASQGQALIGKWDSAANQRSYLLRVQAGVVFFNWSTAGTASVFAQRPLPQLPRRAALRATMDVNNGAGGFTITFYWATSMAGPWTQVGDPVSSTPPTSIYAGTAPLEIAPQSVAGVPPMRGIVHRAEVRTGINGALVADLDVRALAAGTTGWTDSAGRAWTLGAAAVIDDRQFRFYGEISSWPARWDVSGRDVYVPVDASGTTRRLGQGKKALESTLKRRIPSAPSLLAYWPLEEAQTAGTQAYSPVPGAQPLALTGATWAADDTLGGSAPLPTVKAGTTLLARVPSTTVTGWQIEWVYNVPTLPAVQTEVMRLTIAGATMRSVVLYASVSAIRIEVLAGDGTLLGAFSLSTADALAAFAGKWNRLSIYSGDYGGGASLITATWRDVTTNVRYYAATAPVTGQGRISTVSATWDALLEGMALGHLGIFTTPGTGVLNAPPTTTVFEGADDGFAGESALARIARLGSEEAATVDLVGRGSDYPDVSTRLGPQRPATLLDLLEQIQEADGGILYERHDRTGIGYRDRRTLYNQPVALALNYAAPGEVPPPLEPEPDDQRLRNDVTVTRDGGASARSVVTAGPLSVQPPPVGVGLYDEALTLSLHTDSQPEPIAQWRTHLGTWDGARYPTISVWLHAAPHLVDDVLAMDIGDRVQISNPPPWLPPGVIDQHMLGYTEILEQHQWTLELNCAPAGPWQVGVVEDPVLGRADTDGTELAVAVSDTATVWPITVTAGPDWITTATHPTEFPFGVTAGGEQATVTRITGVAEDAFGRTVATGWGSADSGQTWLTDGGSAADYSVGSGTGRHTINTRGIFLHSYVPVTAPDVDLRVDWALGSLPAGDHMYLFPMVRYTDLTHMYMARVQVTPAGAVFLTLRKRNGAETQLGGAYSLPGTYTVGTWYSARLAMTGSTLTGKVWRRSDPEPGWQLSATDADLSGPGSVGLRSFLSSSSTNPLPLTAAYDNLRVGPTAMTVVRSVNGIVKGHAAGTDLSLTYPMRAAL
ncbi:hypothetical protein ABT007_00935 [Streptomyces griseus]|uniref:hypothetical protein n=1 Tax=Streptomyces griseus TaxID=1911 RepID=UPI00331BF73B